jgi:hypothetical protein
LVWDIKTSTLPNGRSSQGVREKHLLWTAGRTREDEPGVISTETSEVELEIPIKIHCVLLKKKTSYMSCFAVISKCFDALIETKLKNTSQC